VASASFGKREREKEQRERAAAKRERRATRTSSEPGEDPEDLERFRVLSEAFAAGTIDNATYVAQRREILTALGMSDAFEE
jgi:hypothetical protein